VSTYDSAYANDHRVQPHPDDGSWMVFSSDYRTEWWVIQNCCGWDAYDADGSPIPAASGKPSRDEAIRVLIGDPR
jgi:hypothetical protein